MSWYELCYEDCGGAAGQVHRADLSRSETHMNTRQVPCEASSLNPSESSRPSPHGSTGSERLGRVCLAHPPGDRPAFESRMGGPHRERDARRVCRSRRCGSHGRGCSLLLLLQARRLVALVLSHPGRAWSALERDPHVIPAAASPSRCLHLAACSGFIDEAARDGSQGLHSGHLRCQVARRSLDGR